MRGEVARDLRKSAAEFLRVVWPAIRPACGGGQLRPVETVTAQGFQADLDQLAGIDAWQVIDGKGIRGISSRIQWVKKPFRTFTIRKSRATGARTEWDKRLEGLRLRHKGLLQPHLIVHAYIAKPCGEGPLLYACMCKVEDLFAFADEKYRGQAWYEPPPAPDGNTFAAFRVAWLKAQGVNVFEFDVEKVATA